MAAWIEERRRDAAALDAVLPVPTMSEEHWRYTNLRGIDFKAFEVGVAGAPGDIDGLLLASSGTGGRIMQRDASIVSASVSESLTAAGVVFAPLEQAVIEHGRLLEPHLGRLVGTGEKFATENAALWTGGAVLYVPAGVTVSEPVHVAFEIATEGAAQQWRVLIVLGDGASATFIEEHAPGRRGYANGVAEIVVGSGARLTYATFQRRNAETMHFASHRAELGRDANLEWVSAANGSSLGKTRMTTVLAGTGGTMRLTGGYFLDGKQHVDLDTTQEHEAAHCTSDLMFKGVLTDRARSVWRGVIQVARGAQRTDSYQENRNLLLSDRAHADSIPGLEIEANDVRCTHGATIGRVDSEQLYYLMARGLPRVEAERLIVQGFFGQLGERVEDEAIRAAMVETLLARLV